MFIFRFACFFLLYRVAIATSVIQPISRARLVRSPKPNLSREEFKSLSEQYSTLQARRDTFPNWNLATQTPLILNKHKKPSVPLLNLFDEQYLMLMSIGTPPQDFRVLPDLGLSEMWVLGKSAGRVFCHDHGCYNPSRSKTFERNGSRFIWEYPDSLFQIPFRGHVSIDTLNVATIDATKQPFGVVNLGNRIDFAFYFELHPNDGLFGLGPVKYSKKNGVLSPIYNLLPSNSRTMFSLYLGGEPLSLDSEIIFGGIDPNHFSGNLHEISALKGRDTWAVSINSIFIGKETIKFKRSPTLEFDSTSSRIGLPGNLFAYFESRIIPEDPEEACNARSGMPDLIFDLSGKNYTLTPHDYIFEPIDNFCLSRLSPTDSDLGQGPKFVLGLSFLAKYYSVYDLKEHTISLALAR